MPSLIAPSDISAIGDNVITQLNSILKGTPLAQVRSLNDITPSLLLDLYELLFHVKLPYATPRDLSAESQLRNIRVLIGHIAHDILKMDLSFLEPQRICMRDERALADFLRIFLGVTKLRKAHLERGGSGNSTPAASPAKRSEQRSEEDIISLDGSEHTIRATPSRENTLVLRRTDEKKIVVRSLNSTPQKRPVLNKAISASATPRSHLQASALRSYKSYGNIEVTEREVPAEPVDDALRRRSSQHQIRSNVPPPPSDTSSVPSDFIHNVNERVSNIWNKLNSRQGHHISDRISERPSSHSPRRPLSTTTSDVGQLAAVPEDTIGSQDFPSPQPLESPSLQEPTPAMKAWLDSTGISGSSHEPRSTQSTPQKPIPKASTHTAPAGVHRKSENENPLYSSPEESPLRPNYTTRSKSFQQPHLSQRTPPKFSLRRTMSEPKFGIDLAKAMFSNEPIRLPRQNSTQNVHQHDSDSSDEEGDDDTTSEAPPSPTSSIATSALSVSSVEWEDTASIAELRKKRLAALEEVKKTQEEATKQAAVASERRAYTPSKLRSSVQGKPQPPYVHNRRRSSIPSTFIHHRNGPQSEASYQTISPNSSASVAIERWRARWNAEGGENQPPIEGSPVPRGKARNLPPEAYEDDIYEGDDVEEVYRDEYDDDYEEGEEFDDQMTRNTDDMEMELKGLGEVGLSESKRQIMLFEKLIRRAVDKRPL